MHPLSKPIADDIRRRLNIPTDEVSDADADNVDPGARADVHHPRADHGDGNGDAGRRPLAGLAEPAGADATSTPRDPAAERAAGDGSTLSPAPATSEASATPDPGKVWSLHPQADVAPPAKPKRKAKSATTLDLEAWGKCCQAWDGMTGRTRAWRPEAGDGKTIAAAMLEQGTAKVAARFDQAARDAWCCGAARDSGRPLSVSALTRAKTALTSRLDAAAEQATLDAEGRSERAADQGATLTRPSGENRSQPQPAPKQNGSAAWDDMLTTIRTMHGAPRLSLGVRGSTLSHDPAEQARRAAAIVAIGGWSKICDAGDHNRGIIRAQWVAAYDRAGVVA